MKFISIVSPEKIDIIQLDNLLYCKSDRKLTHFFDVNQQQYTATKYMGEFETELLTNGFYRIHHSYIVNLKYLKRIVSKNAPFVELFTDIILPISKRKYLGFRQHLGIKKTKPAAA